jgi:hypothetical protein
MAPAPTVDAPVPAPTMTPPPMATISPFPAPPPDGDIIFNAQPMANRRVVGLWYASLGLEYLRQMPGLSLDSIESERTLPEQRLGSSGPLTTWRAKIGVDLLFSRRWIMNLGGFGVGSAIGPLNRVLLSADGSPVEMRPWSTGVVTISGPGVGFQLTKRRWTFGGNTHVALDYFWMGASVATGRTITDVTVAGWLGSLRLGLQACRRVGPLDNACLFFESRVYDTTSFNGGSVGLRWEFGG